MASKLPSLGILITGVLLGFTGAAVLLAPALDELTLGAILSLLILEFED